MKKSYFKISLITLISILTFSINSAFSQYREVNPGNIKRGERLTYLAHYGMINAARATVKLNESLYRLNNRIDI